MPGIPEDDDAGDDTMEGNDDPPVVVDGEPVVPFDDFTGVDDGLSFGQILIPRPVRAHSATIVVKTFFGDLITTVDVPAVGTDETPNSTTSTTAVPADTEVSTPDGTSNGGSGP